jgi:hypothetical protein
MRQAVQKLSRDQRLSLLQWITQQGPFWEEARNHRPGDWLEWNGVVVTDTAVGEAAWCCLHGTERSLVSLSPSNWQFSHVPVDWRPEINGTRTVNVSNYWDAIALEAVLKNAPVPIASWDGLRAAATARCTQLTFAADAFEPLNGHPFVQGAAQRLLVLLNVLDRCKSCFDANGQRTAEGNKIYQDFFTGQAGGGGRGSAFSDSSESEKRDFRTELTFKHPLDGASPLFCPWHGKVQTPQLRVHFSSPISADAPLYVVYVGPKLTKR